MCIGRKTVVSISAVCVENIFKSNNYEVVRIELRSSYVKKRIVRNFCPVLRNVVASPQFF